MPQINEYCNFVVEYGYFVVHSKIRSVLLLSVSIVC